MKAKKTRSLFVLLLAVLMLLMSSCDGFMIVPITTGTQTESGEVERTPETDEFGSEIPTEEFDTSLPTLEDTMLDGTDTEAIPATKPGDTPATKPSDTPVTKPEIPTKEPEIPTAPEETTGRPVQTTIPDQTTRVPEDYTTVPGGEVTATPEVGTTTEETPVAPDTPSYDFEGKELRVLFTQSSLLEAEWGSDDRSDAFSSEIYQRNMAMEDKLNLCLVWECISGSYSSNELVMRVETLCNVGENIYQVVSSYPRHHAVLASRDYFANLRDEQLSALNLNSENWSQSFAETATVGEALYMAVGRINTSAVRNANVVIFNEDMHLVYGFENLYDLYKEGRWTVEIMEEYIRDVYMDLDCDATVSENDMFGLVGYSPKVVIAAAKGMNLSLAERNEKGVYKLNVNERAMVAFDQLLDMKGQRGFYVSNVDPDVQEIFLAERALFCIDFLDRIVQLHRDGTFNYGVLPFPKLDEEQESYGVGVNVAHSVISVVKSPVASQNDFEMVAVALNELNSNTETCLGIYLLKYSTTRDMYELCSDLMEMLRWDGSVLINNPIDSGIIRSAFEKDLPLATQVEMKKGQINSMFAEYFTMISQFQ